MLWPALLLLLPGGQGVRIYKCCSLDKTLDPGGECVPTPGAEWLPLVYSPGKKGFLPQGETPALWEVEAGHLPSCAEPLAAHQDSPELPALLMFENGSLWLHESGGLVEPGLFCVDSGAALVCPSHPTVPGSVRKCCGEAAAWSESKGSCVSWSQGALNLSGPVVAGFPPCHGPQMGYVVSPLPDHLPATADYCVEYVLDQGPSLVTCDVPATDHQLRFSLYPAGLLVSCVFLAATLAAGCLLPASHHAIHWRCQTCHVACLLAGYLLLAIVQLGGHDAPPLLCSTLGVVRAEGLEASTSRIKGIQTPPDESPSSPTHPVGPSNPPVKREGRRPPARQGGRQREQGAQPGQTTRARWSRCKLANAFVVLSSTAEDGEIEVRISGDSNLNLPVLGSLAQHYINTLANYATKAGFLLIRSKEVKLWHSPQMSRLSSDDSTAEEELLILAAVLDE
uniref:(California timema) hypothetical protein n=1 Tax=Timema californicum TaxID=61474 RepID=A0A7R9IV02_TIMCA|nr:unnamed protein product [Timema californicum]